MSDAEDSDEVLEEPEYAGLGEDEGAEEDEDLDAGEGESDYEIDEDEEDESDDEDFDDDELDDDELDDDELDDDDFDEDEDDEDEDDDAEDFDDDDWLDDDEVEQSRSRVASLPADKRRYQQYLADLDADDALEPLSRRALDGIAPEPLLLGSGRRRGPWLGLALFGLNLVLALLLGLQYVAANITTLSGSTSLAPVLPLICQVLDCPAPSRSDLASLHSEELLVRAHPRYAEALEVSIIFRNDADRPQPFPALELGFSDLNNRQHSNRLFQPAEYLPQELRDVREMPARSSVQVVLELSDPGSVTANYTLAFREP